MLNWLGQAVRDFYAAYGWVAAIITFVVLLAALYFGLWLFGVDVNALLGIGGNG